MKLLNYIASIALIVLLNPNLYSQSEPCGTITEAHHDYGKFKKNNIIKVRSDYVLPIQLHIVSRDNGFFEANVVSIVDDVKLTATYFNSINIDLRLCGINYIENSELYDFDKSNGYDLIESYNEPNVLNLYIVETLVSQSGVSLCGTAFFPWAFTNLIIMKRTCSSNGSTMAHEIGHALGLYHTHDTRFDHELVDRSNCETAGDLICDTPADPRLSASNINSSCLYVDVELDSNGDVYDPSPENLMSYSRKNCRNLFTDEQGIVMRNVFDEYYSNYQCQSQSFDAQVLIYPNPTRDILKILVFESIDFEVNLYNMSGILVQNWRNETQLSLGSLPEGIYVIEITDAISDDSVIEKIMIRR